jgi:GMP synthase-like glutamine amidotransferase
MKIHILQHVPFEGPGNIEKWAKKWDHDVYIHNIRHEEYFPKIEEVDLLIIMGGPMSVNDSAKFNWLKNEINYVNEYLSKGKFALGICLGAQILAKSLGAEVKRAKKTEIGWFEIRKTHEGRLCKYFAGLPEKMITFHWHGESFELPMDCKNLIDSEANTNQAFCGDNFLGLQFHFEQTELTIKNMIDKTGKFLPVSDFVMEADEILSKKEHLEANKKYLFRVLDNIQASI